MGGAEVSAATWVFLAMVQDQFGERACAGELGLPYAKVAKVSRRTRKDIQQGILVFFRVLCATLRPLRTGVRSLLFVEMDPAHLGHLGPARDLGLDVVAELGR